MHNRLVARQGIFSYVKEWVKYLLISEARGVEISQRYGERWSRFARDFWIFAFL